MRQASPFGLTKQLCPRHEGAGLPPTQGDRLVSRTMCVRRTMTEQNFVSADEAEGRQDTVRGGMQVGACLSSLPPSLPPSLPLSLARPLYIEKGGEWNGGETHQPFWLFIHLLVSDRGFDLPETDGTTRVPSVTYQRPLQGAKTSLPIALPGYRPPYLQRAACPPNSLKYVPIPKVNKSVYPYSLPGWSINQSMELCVRRRDPLCTVGHAASLVHWSCAI